MTALGVTVAGAAGAVARAVVDAVAARHAPRGWPWGTFAINVSGSLVAGILAALVLHHGLEAAPKAVSSAGFLGAYTTFSTHAFEVVALARQGEGRVALGYAIGSASTALAAAAVGVALATAI